MRAGRGTVPPAHFLLTVTQHFFQKPMGFFYLSYSFICLLLPALLPGSSRGCKARLPYLRGSSAGRAGPRAAAAAAELPRPLGCPRRCRARRRRDGRWAGTRPLHPHPPPARTSWRHRRPGQCEPGATGRGRRGAGPLMRGAARRGAGDIRGAAGRRRESAEAAGGGGAGLSRAEPSRADRGTSRSRDEALGRPLAVWPPTPRRRPADLRARAAAMVKCVGSLVSPLGAWRPLAPRGAGLIPPPPRPSLLRPAARVAAAGLLRPGGHGAASSAPGKAAAVPGRRGHVLSPREGRAGRRGGQRLRGGRGGSAPTGRLAALPAAGRSWGEQVPRLGPP